MIPIKNDLEILKMREACSIAATVLERMCTYAEEGMTTYDLDQYGKELIETFGAKSACFNYKSSTTSPFPSYTCLSVNEEVVHGIGTMKRMLKAGDIVSIDVSIVYNEFIGDNARTIPIGQVSEEVSKLLEVTEEALATGINQAIPGARVGDISHSIQKHVESRGFSIVRDFVGHGVGRSIHEEPQIPNYGRPHLGPKLKQGMTLAIEPMVNLGKYPIEFASDGWTALTKDRLPSAHFEHTVLISENQPEILTIPKK